mgnify:CR=1 FL=1
MTATVPMTAEEFSHWDAPGDYELVDGEPVSLPSSSPLHNLIRFTLAKLLMMYLDRTSTGTLIGETDCIAGANTIRRPDLSVRGERGRHHRRRSDRRSVPATPAQESLIGRSN